MGLLGEIGKFILSDMESTARRNANNKSFRPEQREAYESMAGMLNDVRNGNFNFSSDDDDE